MKFKKQEIAVMILLGRAIVVSVVVLFLIFREYSEGDRKYHEMTEYVFLPEEETAVPTRPGIAAEDGSAPGSLEPTAPTPELSQGGTVVDTGAPIVDFAGLQQQNPDIIGWIYSAGTEINYPIVQGKDNEEYLYRMADGTNNRCGSIFLDYQNDREFQDANSVINGHHMKNGSMFSSLLGYVEQEYYNEHPRIWLVTPDKTYSLELFAGIVTDSESDVWKLSFTTEEDFAAWKSEMVRHSYFKSTVIPRAEEKVVTLSTCTYDFEGARFVVMGVLR